MRLKGVRWGRRALPQELSEGVETLADLKRRGVFDEVGKRLVVARRSGAYVGVDAVIALLLFYMRVLLGGGVRGFFSNIREYAVGVANLAGRASLMSSSALSSLLSDLKEGDVAAFSRWFLVQGSGLDRLLRRDDLVPRDASGVACHVFWYDPSREAYRQRRLPQGTDRPEPERRTAQLAQPGHRGRKRGEVTATYGLLQHVSGGWIEATFGPGNGAPRAQFAAAVAALVATCQEADIRLDNTLLVCDGEFGDVPYLDAALRAKVPLITRSSRYDLLKSERVRRQLNRSTWRVVPSGGTGPVRWAADLGEVEFPAGESTKREDGGRYEPVRTRVIVTRRVADGHGPGVDIDGYRFELFVACGVLATAWPAEHVVAAYFARSAQENAFSHLDKELHVDQTVSFQPAGQLLAAICALFVWNHRLVRGLSDGTLPPVPQFPHPQPTDSQPPPLNLDVPEDEDEPLVEAEVVVPPPKEPGSAVADVLTAAGIAARVERKGWTWDPATGELHDGTERFEFSFVSARESNVRFASAVSRKTRSINLPKDVIAEVQAIHHAGARPPALERRPHVKPDRWLVGPPPPLQRYDAPLWPTFSPLAARRHAVQQSRRRILHLSGQICARLTLSPHPLAAPSHDRRRHVRHTRKERLDARAASDRTTVIAK